MANEASAASGRLNAGASLAALGGLWLLMRPYAGFVGDSRLYLGRVLGGLDPSGVGRDLLFATPGQFEFTVFPWLARPLVEGAGLQAGSILICLAGLALWLWGLICLARQLSKGPGAWLVAAAVILLAGTYDGVSAFHFGEALATPRVFAEALCLFGLAQLLEGRLVRALALIVLGGAFHPLMALGAAGVALVYMALADRRWTLAAAAGAVLVLAGAFMGAPILERLLVHPDPVWRAVIWSRSQNILVGSWPAAYWSVLTVDVAVLALAALEARGPTHRWLLACLITGVCGLAAAFLLGDLAQLILVLQLQLWRAVWLLVLASSAGLALLALNTPVGGEREASLPVLALAVGFAGVPVIGLPALVFAVLLRCAPPLRASRMVLLALWTLSAALILARASMTVRAAMSLAGGMPVGAALPYQAWEAALDIAAVAVLVLLLARRFRPLAPWPSVGASVLLIVFAACLWDARTPAERRIEAGPGPSSFNRLVAARPGEVYWADGDVEPWVWLHRASWTSSMQGAGVVFSPRLATTWSARTALGVSGAMMSPEARTPFEPTRARPLQPTPAQLQAFCAAPGAPAWVVLPDQPASSPLRAMAAASWRPDRPAYQLSFAGSVLRWRGGREFLLLPCAGR